MLEKIIEYIKQKYNPLSIILYGSYANGTNNLNSDFDALVISYDHEQFHDTSFVNDIQLDVFVYPASYFDGEFDCNNFIQIFDGMIIVDNEERGKTLQMKVRSYLQNRPQKTKAEIDVNVDWCIPSGEVQPGLPETLAGEPVVMQGAVDCAFEEDGGLVIVDFKTDHTKDEAALWERYRAQLALYRRALTLCTGLPVKECLLYSFYLNREIRGEGMD